MWIKWPEYERLKYCEQMNKKLDEETKRLSELISAQVEDCRVGPWCKDCVYIGYDLSKVDGFGGYEETSGQVIYCKKHIHEMCKEFEKR